MYELTFYSLFSFSFCLLSILSDWSRVFFPSCAQCACSSYWETMPRKVNYGLDYYDDDYDDDYGDHDYDVDTEDYG